MNDEDAEEKKRDHDFMPDAMRVDVDGELERNEMENARKPNARYDEMGGRMRGKNESRMK